MSAPGTPPGPRIAIVIPCYNESATLGAVIEGCREAGEVMVIDDGSTDTSVAIARDRGATVLSTPGRTGYDGAIEFGLRAAHAAGAQVVVTIDADGEHDPRHVAEFLAAHERGAALVVGIRPRPQRLAERLVCGFCSHRFGIRDILCGMKGMTRQVLDSYFADGRPNLVNTWPALLWRSGGGDVTQIAVGGTPRTDTPRFQSRLRANLRIASMLGPIRQLPAPPGDRP